MRLTSAEEAARAPCEGRGLGGEPGAADGQGRKGRLSQHERGRGWPVGGGGGGSPVIDRVRRGPAGRGGAGGSGLGRGRGRGRGGEPERNGRPRRRRRKGRGWRERAS